MEEIKNERSSGFCLCLPNPADAVVDGLDVFQFLLVEAAHERLELSQSGQPAGAGDLSLARQPARHCVSTRVLVAAVQGLSAGRNGARFNLGISFSARGFLSALALVIAWWRLDFPSLDAVLHEHLLPASARALSDFCQLGSLP